MKYPITLSSPRKGWRGWKFAGIGAAILGALALSACHHGGPGWHHGPGAMSGQMTPEEASKRIDKAVNWVLDDVDATADQKQKVSGIAKGALADLIPLRDQHHAARVKALELLSQTTIDRAAMEQLRAQELQLADTASKRVTQALADIADAITPEQRQKLVEQFKKRMG
jgi:protein CpxP